MNNEMKEMAIYTCIQWLLSVPKIGPARVKNMIETWSNQSAVLSDMFYGNEDFHMEAISEAIIKSNKWLTTTEIKELLSNKMQIDEQTQSRVQMWKQRDSKFSLLTCFSPAYPQILREIHDYPLILYCTGDLNLLSQESMAIVGTRSPSNYGKMTAEWFGKTLAQWGVNVVSGFADGIDSHAHMGALEGGKTIAVLGAGYQSSYIRRNKRLYDLVLQKGLMVSEYPPEVQPRTGYFPMRNRIISGISRGTILIEAGERSGALITARYATEHNRELYVVPSDAMLMKNKGGHRFIADGAMLVDDPMQVIDDLKRLISQKENFQIFDAPNDANQKNKYSESENKKKIQCYLKNKGVISYDDLAKMTGIPIGVLKLEIIEMALDEEIILHGNEGATLKY